METLKCYPEVSRFRNLKSLAFTITQWFPVAAGIRAWVHRGWFISHKLSQSVQKRNKALCTRGGERKVLPQGGGCCSHLPGAASFALLWEKGTEDVSSATVIYLSFQKICTRQWKVVSKQHPHSIRAVRKQSGERLGRGGFLCRHQSHTKNVNKIFVMYFCALTVVFLDAAAVSEIKM